MRTLKLLIKMKPVFKRRKILIVSSVTFWDRKIIDFIVTEQQLCKKMAKSRFSLYFPCKSKTLKEILVQETCIYNFKLQANCWFLGENSKKRSFKSFFDYVIHFLSGSKSTILFQFSWQSMSDTILYFIYSRLCYKLQLSF